MKSLKLFVNVLFIISCLSVVPAFARLSKEDISGLKERGRKEGWTFEVGENEATQYDLNKLCGQLPLTLEEENERQSQFKGKGASMRSEGELPSSFDWRSVKGCPPIRNQGGCGSCWAFAAIGALECAIKIFDGNTVDLSEQWLVSCTSAGNCGGGSTYSAVHYFIPGRNVDFCGHYGSVWESDFPYTASVAPCGCPYGHRYRVKNWSYLSNDIVQIKNAIMTYGPVTAYVYSSSAFQYYTGGIFNAFENQPINHAVVLVGWDDTQGTNGVWFLRNSFSAGWGENGYMRIAYGCNSINDYCAYIIYDPNPCPTEINVKQGATNIPDDTGSYDFRTVMVGQNKPVTFTIENLDSGKLDLTGSPKVQISGTYASDFVVTQQPSTPVLPSSSTAFKITFAPSGEELRSATISIQNNDADENPYNFLITGTGISVEIVAWGNNGYGQCTLPSPNTGFTAIAAGYGHSLGLKTDGSIVAWGWNDFGQCTVPSPNTGFTAIEAGWLHSLGLKTNGSIVAWGNNGFGQCTLPSPNTDFTAISAGGYYSLGLKTNGSIVAWGNNEHSQCTLPSPNTGFTDIAAGGFHSLGLKNDGSIVAWGGNLWGEGNVPEPNTGFTAIAAGEYHSLGLKTDGSIVAWGDNDYGQCNVPPPNTGFMAIAAGDWHSLGLKQDGSIVAWGWGNYGLCTVPSPNTGFIAIAAGGYHSLGLKAICLFNLDGDLNNDYKVDFEDLTILADQWLQPPGTPSADIAPLPNGDGITNLFDYVMMADNWLVDCFEEPPNSACVQK